jgi:formiminoglutamase
MNEINLYSAYDVKNATKKRAGEIKVGDRVKTFSANWQQDLQKMRNCFVLIGIAEDIGVRANYGRGGAHTAFKPAMESILTQQSNEFFNGDNIYLLGEVHTEELMEKSSQLNRKTIAEIQQLRELTAKIDEKVALVVEAIVRSGNIPIVIGGGHNNSYGNLRGCFKALGEKVNVINCDPHLDFRPLEGRHSGNGFSYAFSEGFVDRYSVFAMHEQYNNAAAIEEFRKNPSSLFFNTYESIFIRENIEFNKALLQSIGFVKNKPCGVELDLDAITNVPSSAKTSSGISPVQARQYVHHCGKNLKPLYLHIAEGAPILSHIKADNKTGKLIAYLVTDFIKAVMASTHAK